MSAVHETDCPSRLHGYVCELCVTCEHETPGWHRFTFPSGASLDWSDAQADPAPHSSEEGV